MGLEPLPRVTCCGVLLRSRVRRLWGMLASVPRGYEGIMESLQQRMTWRPEPGAPEPSDRRQISPLIVRQGGEELWGAGRGFPRTLGSGASAFSYPRLVEHSRILGWGRWEGFPVGHAW